MPPIEATLLSAMVPLKVITLPAPGAICKVEPVIMKISEPAEPPAGPKFRLAPPTALLPAKVEEPVSVSVPLLLMKIAPP